VVGRSHLFHAVGMSWAMSCHCSNRSRLLRRLELLHRPLALAHRSMRVLGCVVQALVTTVISVWHGPLDGWQMTSELVGHNHPRLDAILRVEHAMQEALCGVLVASTLTPDVQHGSILVDGTPQPVPVLVDRESHFVQMPLVAASRMTPMKLACQQWAELAAPEPDGLVTDLDPTFGEQFALDSGADPTSR
jgi:hypothetical protein